MIKLSQSLDDLIYRCVFCEKELKLLSDVSLSLKNIFGTHSSFYYYGKEHLFINMLFYITEGIKNNEIIYISMQENLYDQLIEFLRRYEIDIEQINFRPVKELIITNKQGGLTALKEKINKISVEDAVQNYTGVRWIGQPTYAIKTTAQEDFLNWEIHLSKSLKNKNISLLCIYDAYDYMHEGKFINEEVIRKSINTHDYMLKDLRLKKNRLSIGG